MSTTSIPTISMKKYNASNAFKVLAEGRFSAEQLKGIEGMFGDALMEVANEGAKEILDDFTDFMNTAAEECWTTTSFYTGNTRGALKQVGDNYLEYELVFDKDWWFKHKTLPSLHDKVVERTWKNKRTGKTRSKTYTYEAGKMIEITGEDYSPRIPSPNHTGEIETLVDAYESIKDEEFRKAGF